MFRFAFLLLATISTTNAFVAPKLALAAKTMTSLNVATQDRQYTLSTDKKRKEQYKEENNERYLNIDKFYDPAAFKGKRVAVVSCNRGVGLQIATELSKAGAELIAITRTMSKELEELNTSQLIKDIDVMDDSKVESLKDQIKGGPLDLVICVSGYSSGQRETLDDMIPDELLKTLNTNTLGPLRVIGTLVNNGLLTEGGKAVVLTSQDGSFSLRPDQNPDGKDLGYQISKAGATMMAYLLSMQLKEKGIAIGPFHPGFNRTDMTKVMKDKWDEMGAVDPNIGAKRVLYEASKLSMETTGVFRNTEDGLEIPW